MEVLRDRRRYTAEWPMLLRHILTCTYLNERELAIVYAGDVFKDRDTFSDRATTKEKKAVKQLFRHCHENAGGVLVVGEERYWLMGYEWPNQGGNKEKGCRADLIGLNSSGGLAVFECKLVNNDGPMTAVLEGLDYLACLTTRPNFAKVAEGFHRWVIKKGRDRPDGFQQAGLKREATHEVVVLAPTKYYDTHRTHSPGWEEFAGQTHEPSSPLVIRLASSDFDSPNAEWVRS